MLKCIDCGYEQVSGKFCGDCGTKFEETDVMHEIRTLTKIGTPTQGEPNIHLEKLKMQAKAYASYFLQHLKNPVLAYDRGKSEFTNGLTSIILFAVLLALALFTSMNVTTSSFISLFSGALIFILLAMGIALLSLTLITTFLGPQQPFKTLISLYGAHLPSLLVGAIASLLLLLLNSFLYGNLMLSLVFLVAVFLVPLYLLSVFVTKQPPAVDPLYVVILYLLTFSILFAVFFTLLADSAIGSYFYELMYWFS